MLFSCTINVRHTGSYGFVGAVHGLDESSFIELFELALTFLFEEELLMVNNRTQNAYMM